VDIVDDVNEPGLQHSQPTLLGCAAPAAERIGRGRGDLLGQVDVGHVRFHFGNGDFLNLGGDGLGARWMRGGLPYRE
jgi:hypothetical protein